MFLNLEATKKSLVMNLKNYKVQLFMKKIDNDLTSQDQNQYCELLCFAVCSCALQIGITHFATMLCSS